MEKQVIHVTVFKPHNSLFKQFRNDRAKCRILKCNNFSNCGLYKRNECCWLAALGWDACPYGSLSVVSGYTKKARSYYKWIKEKEELYKDCLNKLSQASKVMAVVGDFVYLPYSWATMNKLVPFKADEGFFKKGNCLLLKDAFTIENIISICKFRPMAMMGGEIKDYQEKEVPKFVKHLSEAFPEKYKQLCEVYPKAKEYTLTDVGRKAFLKTLTPNVGVFKDIHGGIWSWDGKYITSENSHASFLLVSKFSELKAIPEENSVVTITDDGQVNENTRFYKS